MTMNYDYLQCRALSAWKLASPYYEPGNHARSLKQVWRKYVAPQMGIGYRTFLRYKKMAEQCAASNA